MKYTCKIEGCDSPSDREDGLCRRHHRQYQNGNLSLECRLCKGCGINLPVNFRPDRLFCTPACKMKFHRKHGCYTKESTLITRGTCSIEGCKSPVHANKLCQIHNNNLRRNGDPLTTRKKVRGICTIAGCTRVHLAKGYCGAHYKNFRLHGNPAHEDEMRQLRSKYEVEYARWIGMKTRCNNPNAANYALYGGKGIKVCKQWNEDFRQFLNDVGPMPGSNYQLARRDHSGNYEPSNVSWQPEDENSRYHSGVTINYAIASKIRDAYDEGNTMQELAKEYNLTIGHIHKIIANSVWIDEFYKPEPNRRKSKLNNVQKEEIKKRRHGGETLTSIARDFKVTGSVIHTVVRDGFRGAKASHELFNIWSGMMRRCYEPNNSSYHNYGGRGIRVDERWHDFYNFVADVGPRPSNKHTLDRINDGNYEPGNVKWSTYSEQNRNKRATKKSIVVLNDLPGSNDE